MATNNFVIIEDDVILAGQLKSILELESFEVQVYHSSEEFLLTSKSAQVTPFIYLIDLNLPGLTGSELVKVIRFKDKLSPIFIISGASLDTGLSKCLSAGADDYLLKPYNPDHLLLKIKNAQTKLRFMIGSMMEFGVKLIPEAKLVSRDGLKAKLTNREYAIMELLLSAPDKVHSRETLIKEIGDTEITERTIDVHISGLRKKIEKISLEIETCRGKGYRVKGLEIKPVAI